MTETKYIFPKQSQSVTVLVFITVLIVLLLILTVMVHMRNRKLKSTLEEQIAERRLLDKICADFTAVYYVELNTGSFEILHINDGTNAKKMNLKQGDNFNSSADQYAVQYLYEKERKEFKDWISTRYLKEQLSRRERITYHYRSKPNPNQHEFFEAQAIKIYQDEKHFFALVGFRHIDDIMEKETTIQNQLRQALDETRLSNEIISAIAKSYCSIYRIDVQKDFFEEVSNDSEIHKLTGNRGCATEKLYQLCDTMVAPEYRPLIRPFLDVSTLSARLKTEECISTEYRMCDGSWHRMLFIVKKRDESGNVTHVLCTVRSISDSKRREENLNFAAEVAKREAEMKTRFLATMSHDIRTPLNGIIGMVNMGNQYADDPQMQQKIREKAMESLKYLVSLVNDVLDMNKLQSGDLKDQQILFDLTMVLRELNQIYDERAAKKGIWIGTQDKNSNLSDKPVSLDDYSVEGMRALVVEDNELNMEIAEFLIQNEGATVTKAWDGQQAVTLFAKSASGEFDAILMDVLMPVMNGYEAAKIIRSLDRKDAKVVPIIAMTANAFTEDRLKAKEAGMDEHIAKPVDVKLLVKVISRLVENSFWGIRNEKEKME